MVERVSRSGVLRLESTDAIMDVALLGHCTNCAKRARVFPRDLSGHQVGKSQSSGTTSLSSIE